VGDHAEPNAAAFVAANDLDRNLSSLESCR
jgi:hypothetical protein